MIARQQPGVQPPRQPSHQPSGRRKTPRRAIAWVTVGLFAAGAATWIVSGSRAADEKLSWQAQWTKTDFRRRSVALSEIKFVIPRDRIPAVDNPKFVTVAEAAQQGLPDKEPVIGLVVNGDARAYPIRILIWHEIVNDRVGERHAAPFRPRHV